MMTIRTPSDSRSADVGNLCHRSADIHGNRQQALALLGNGHQAACFLRDCHNAAARLCANAPVSPRADQPCRCAHLGMPASHLQCHIVVLLYFPSCYPRDLLLEAPGPLHQHMTGRQVDGILCRVTRCHLIPGWGVQQILHWRTRDKGGCFCACRVTRLATGERNLHAPASAADGADLLLRSH